jgi:hypothetical protein
MNIETYFRNKGPYAGLSRAEATVLRIPFPPQSGWLRRYGSNEISEDQERLLARLPARAPRLRRSPPTTVGIGQLDLFQRDL